MDLRQYPEEKNTAETHLLPGMAFLAENPEAYGFVPDACPAVTSKLMVAANGHGASGGSVSPTYSVEARGIDGLFDTLFGGLIHRTDDNTHLLRATFGENEGAQEHPVARYCAALAETVALQILSGTAKGASFKQTCLMLGSEIPGRLARLRETLEGDTAAEVDPAFYSVSLGACRVTPTGDGDYTVDIFSAGDFRVFLLDGEGFHPLWLTATPLLSPDAAVIPSGRSLEIHHPEPFAVALLSDSVCALNPPEARALRENPGLIWRYRMRLEDQLLRLITACVREQEFGERAARFFTGRSRGRDSASGAMLVLREGVSYEVFRSVCGDRLSRLENMISLLPEGYDPERIPILPSREAVENDYLHHLLSGKSGLSDRVARAVRQCAVQKLREGKDSDTPPPAGVPAYRRLSREEVQNAYRRYDRENDADRDRVTQNRRILRDHLADHWITLRPCFKRVSDRPSSEHAERSYNTCAELHTCLSRMLAVRKQTVARLETLLTDSLTVLQTQKSDWLEGRAGDGCVASWAEGLTEIIPSAATPLLDSWREDTDRYRSLMTAYTYERELLFRLDTEDEGFFADDWNGIRSGTLSDSRWDTLRESLDTLPAHREMLESLIRLSKGTGALLSRVASRDAEGRMARELSGKTELQVAALRASAYEDGDWGEEVVTVLDPAERRDYRDLVRRWKENRELNARRAEAYTVYSAMYHRYLPAGQ